MQREILIRFCRVAVIITIIAIFLGGCAQNASTQRYQNISAIELNRVLQEESNFMLLDVREPYELAETGYIPGTVNIPMGKASEMLKDIPRDRKIIIYCRTGRRSAEVAELLSGKGYTLLYNLEGGIVAWPYEKKK